MRNETGTKSLDKFPLFFFSRPVHVLAYFLQIKCICVVNSKQGNDQQLEKYDYYPEIIISTHELPHVNTSLQDFTYTKM